MKLYKIVAKPDSSNPADTQTHWVGSQADAASRRKQLVTDGFKRVEIETIEHDIPTDKAGLLAWLNENT